MTEIAKTDAAKAKKKFYQKWWFWAIVIVSFILFLDWIIKERNTTDGFEVTLHELSQISDFVDLRIVF